jgi:hypothetical protein
MVKAWMRRHGRQDLEGSFVDKIRAAFRLSISYEAVVNSYEKVYGRACGYDDA